MIEDRKDEEVEKRRGETDQPAVHARRTNYAALRMIMARNRRAIVARRIRSARSGFEGGLCLGVEPDKPASFVRDHGGDALQDQHAREEMRDESAPRKPSPGLHILHATPLLCVIYSNVIVRSPAYGVNSVFEIEPKIPLFEQRPPTHDPDDIASYPSSPRPIRACWVEVIGISFSIPRRSGSLEHAK